MFEFPARGDCKLGYLLVPVVRTMVDRVMSLVDLPVASNREHFVGDKPKEMASCSLLSDQNPILIE